MIEVWQVYDLSTQQLQYELQSILNDEIDAPILNRLREAIIQELQERGASERILHAVHNSITPQRCSTPPLIQQTQPLNIQTIPSYKDIDLPTIKFPQIKSITQLASMSNTYDSYFTIGKVKPKPRSRKPKEPIKKSKSLDHAAATETHTKKQPQPHLGQCTAGVRSLRRRATYTPPLDATPITTQIEQLENDTDINNGFDEVDDGHPLEDDEEEQCESPSPSSQIIESKEIDEIVHSISPNSSQSIEMEKVENLANTETPISNNSCSEGNGILLNTKDQNTSNIQDSYENLRTSTIAFPLDTTTSVNNIAESNSPKPQHGSELPHSNQLTHASQESKNSTPRSPVSFALDTPPSRSKSLHQNSEKSINRWQVSDYQTNYKLPSREMETRRSIEKVNSSPNVHSTPFSNQFDIINHNSIFSQLGKSISKEHTIISTPPRSVRDESTDTTSPVGPSIIDYTQYFPTFSACIVPTFRIGNNVKNMTEFEMLSEQRNLLQLWCEHVIEEDDGPVYDDEEDDANTKARPSALPIRPITITKDWDKTMIDMANDLCYKVQRMKEEVYELITNVLDREKKWSMVSSPMWNLWWTWSKPKFQHKTLLAWQFVNHYPNSIQLTHKDLLKKHVSRYGRLPGKVGAAFNITPKTYILPAEYVAFAEDFAQQAQKNSDTNIWIMKPIGLSRGRGIELVTDIQHVTYGSGSVIQKYIHSPLLVQGHKFDLRLYVLVTSFAPLEAFLFKQGFARFASMKFTLDKASLHNKIIHITNTAIQQNQQTTQLFPMSGVTKCELSELQIYLSKSGIEWNTLWSNIGDTILKCLCCTEQSIGNWPSCFEVFGFDVLIDSDLKPYILEVNASPSMEIDNSLDEEVKESLIKDVLELVRPLQYDRLELAKVLDRRLSEFQKSSRSRSTNEPAFTHKQQTLNKDLMSILKGQVPRRYGEMPTNLGHFERIAPSTNYTKYSKLKRV